MSLHDDDDPRPPVDAWWRRAIWRAVLRLSFKWPSLLPLPVSWLRRGMDTISLAFPVRRDVGVQPSVLGGVPGERLQPLGEADAVMHVLHLHGGAFFTGSCRTHRALAAQIAARCRATVHLLDYRLAPEHPCPAAVDDALAAYQALRAQGVAAGNILLSGDSGGGALALALVQRLQAMGQALPGALYMMSPYLDLRLQLPSVIRLAGHDPMVARHALERGGRAYRGALPASDDRVSPLLGDLDGLPPTLVQVGGDEILLDDARQFTRLARHAGSRVRLVQYQGYWHNFQMFAHDLQAADDALNALARFCTRNGLNRKVPTHRFDTKAAPSPTSRDAA